MALQTETPPSTHWLADLGARVLAWWPAKMFGTTFGIAAFFVCYFAVLRHPQFTVTSMPLTAVDRWIDFQPWTLPLYVSLWVYISLPPTLLRQGRHLASYAAASVVLSGVGLAIFFFWPTTIPTAGIDWSRYPSVKFLKAVDVAGNACPSLHVAFAVFSALWLERLLCELRAARWLRAVNWLWCVGILYSTIAVRQHVFIDVVAGAVLGVVVALAHLRWFSSRPGAAPVRDGADLVRAN